MVFLDEQGIQIGILILMIAVLAPIGLGDLGVQQFTSVLKEPLGILAVLLGILVTVFARQGLGLMTTNPSLVPTSILGIIIGVVLFNGVPIGPLVALGVTASLYGLIQLILR